MIFSSNNNAIYGIFKNEHKNRFLCTVCVDGTDVICYISSSCRLSNFIDLSGKTVLLMPNKSKASKTLYTVYAVKIGRHFVLLNFAQANRVIESQLCRRHFSFLGKRKKVEREIFIESYKTDLFIYDTNTVVEIKSILTFNKKSLFPSVYSERAIKQLQKLSHLLDIGYKVCYLLISLNSQVKELYIDKNDKIYYTLFKECINKGMIVRAFSIHMNEQETKIYKNIDFIS